ncbi:hypothetical protein BT63DRAFT_454909 [Microthyrium microscopicum]|uniref:Uncharacterized protein n=1 Tax=Microthyrium microscopicum TaxID=703497 RepID=A0A6A6UBD5_9PEZI|nr:hypothetical protein BT63DRAFT_454909 [Microthyrium microscopicum]
MKLFLLPLLFLFGGSIATPVPPTTKQPPKAQDTPTMVKEAWTSVGNAYKQLEDAVKGIRPTKGGVTASYVPRAHENLMFTLQNTMNSVRGLKPVGIGEAALGLTLPAYNLRSIEIQAITTIRNSKPIVVQAGERETFRTALVDQFAYHRLWSDTFKALVPTSPQQSFGQGFTDGVLDAYTKTIADYSFD